MKNVGLSLIALWGMGLALLMFGRGRLRFYVNKRTLLVAACFGVLGGLAWIIAEPADTSYGNLGKVAWMMIVSVFAFGIHGKEHPDKTKEREQKWTIDLPDKAIQRLQLVGVAGAFLGSFAVGPAYALFWKEWDDTARTWWVVTAVAVALMVVIPIVVLYTRRRRNMGLPD